MSEITAYDINAKETIVHILDSSTGTPALSNETLQYGSDFADFLKEHICRVFTSDEAKKCQFVKEESEVYNILTNHSNDFVELSKKIAEKMYEILYANIDIPAADLIVAKFEVEGVTYLALLKMNYKESYTHQIKHDSYVNDIVKHRAMLPGKSQKLTEAVIISLDDYSIKLIEKKYDINGEKTNYLSEMFLQCTTKLSQKTKLSIIDKAVESVQKEFFNESEQFEEMMKAKSVIYNELEEHGQVDITELSSQVFGNKAGLREKFIEKIEKYNVSEKDHVKPINETTKKKYQKQKLVTDIGVEIKIPMELYNSTDSIEFVNNPDGTISILIKNIGKITSK